MSKYISIDTLKNTQYIEVNGTQIGVRYSVTFTEIDAMPYINITFCKECKWADGEVADDGKRWCPYHAKYMLFCADGEREGK